MFGVSFNMTSTNSSAPQSSDNRDSLSSVFQNVPESAHASRWDGLWKDGTFLPWNKGHANPALIDLLSSSAPPTSSEPNPSVGAPNVTIPQPLLVALPSSSKQDGTKRRVLIPGCGKGYDVALFAAHGYDAYGLEVSSHAVEIANKYLQDPGEGPLEAEYHAAAQKYRRSAKGKMVCLLGDFFSDEWLAAMHGHTDSRDKFGGFDLIYDNTFLSALPPSLRPSWAARMTELLSPSGALICLEFPTDKLASSAGPPWPLPPIVYLELLKRPGQDVSYDDSGTIVETNRAESDTALVRTVHYIPKRTHGMGIVDGVVRDCVSIWQHTALMASLRNQ